MCARTRHGASAQAHDEMTRFALPSCSKTSRPYFLFASKPAAAVVAAAVINLGKSERHTRNNIDNNNTSSGTYIHEHDGTRAQASDQKLRDSSKAAVP